MKSFIFLIPAIGMLALYQNCSPMHSGSELQSTGDGLGAEVPGDLDDNCLYTSNKPPQITRIEYWKGDQKLSDNILNSGRTIDIDVGMDEFSGHSSARLMVFSRTSTDDTEKIDQVVNDSRCNGGDDQIDVDCDDDFTRVGDLFRNRVDIDPEAECLDGPITFSIQVEDAILNCLNPPDSRRSQAVQVTVRTHNKCLPEKTITADQPENLATLGTRVAIDGSYAVASAPGDDRNKNDAGALTVYRKVSNQWQKMQNLIIPGAQDGDDLKALAIDGNLIVAGASGTSAGGTIYFFSLESGQWNLKGQVDGPAGSSIFGDSLAINGSRVAVGDWGYQGTKGIIHIYDGWNASSKVTISPNDLEGDGRFGRTLAFWGERLVVGAPHSDTVYSLKIPANAAQWSIEEKLTGAANGGFGSALALANNKLLVGAPTESSAGRNPMTRAGNAYLYSFSSGSWGTAQRVAHEDQSAEDQFGSSVAFSGSNLLVSAPRKGDKSGAIYLFNGSGNQSFKIRTRQNLRNAEDQFGWDIAVNGSKDLMVGTPLDDPGSIRNSGSVTFVRLP